MSKIKQPKVTLADRLASQKLADRYINRKGGAPSALTAARDARQQNLNDDDRRHLKFCLREIRNVCLRSSIAETCFDFVEALLDRDYKLFTVEQRRQDESALVNSAEDPELYDHMVRKKQ
jgi:hypothetical protein